MTSIFTSTWPLKQWISRAYILVYLVDFIFKFSVKSVRFSAFKYNVLNASSISLGQDIDYYICTASSM